MTIWQQALHEATLRARDHWATADFRCSRCGCFIRSSIAPATAQLPTLYLHICCCKMPVGTTTLIETAEEWAKIIYAMTEE
jgi:hypothetical protein